MENHPAEVLREALALPVEARSALIDSLIESLDATVDEGATEAWKREIELRLKQIDDGRQAFPAAVSGCLLDRTLV